MGTHRFRFVRRPAPVVRSVVRRVARRAVRRAAGRVGDGAAAAGALAGGTRLGPQLAYARMVDGDRLWLAVPDGSLGTGRPALRDRVTGEVHLPADEDGHRAGPLTWVRWRLSDAVPTGERGGPPADVELELVATGGDRPRALRLPPLPSVPTAVPPTADGRWQFALHRHRDGRLLVRRSALPPRAALLRVAAVPDGIEVTARPAPGGPPDPTVLVVRDGRVHRRLATAATGDARRAVVTADDVPDGSACEVAVDGATGPVPVVRHANGLRDPAAGTLLPKVFAATDGAELVVSRFAPDGRLLVRRPGPG